MTTSETGEIWINLDAFTWLGIMKLDRAASSTYRFVFRAWRAVATLIPGGRFRAFGVDERKIGAILVVNLDRQPNRLRAVNRELKRFRSFEGVPLNEISQRLSAVDARDSRAVAATIDVDPIYRIRDQLYVQPDPRLAATFGVDEQIRMTRQEVAVARSHIEVWKRVATGSDLNVLVLEDDVWFTPRARSAIDRGWQKAASKFENSAGPNLLYLSYEDAGGLAERSEVSEALFRPVRGLWFLSGYVLSREAARELLSAMPVVGPVDLWMNYQFPKLDVLALSSPAIAQRPDTESGNAYSVMPYLARAGIVDGRHAAGPPDSSRAGPILVWSDTSETESLPMAISMLGLRVRVFDVDDEPMDERGLSSVLTAFDALVNPPLSPEVLATLPMRNWAKVLLGPGAQAPTGLELNRLKPPLLLNLDDGDSTTLLWDPICDFLRVPVPVERFPVGSPRELGLFRDGRSFLSSLTTSMLGVSGLLDDSPWVMPSPHRFSSSRQESTVMRPRTKVVVEHSLKQVSETFPSLNETFPGNLATFSPENITYSDEGTELSIGLAEDGVRPFCSGAFASVHRFTHGQFRAEIRAAAGSGLVTGFFLYRASPRQEIDIEFMGGSPRKMLTNVFFNPGDEDTSMDYGYRGSPCWIDLGFDSTADFHEYAIDWSPDRITWTVDGKIVHERVSWDPTPIPHLEMRAYGNLWSPRSQELAGVLSKSSLPSSATFRNISITK